ALEIVFPAVVIPETACLAARCGVEALSAAAFLAASCSAAALSAAAFLAASCSADCLAKASAAAVLTLASSVFLYSYVPRPPAARTRAITTKPTTPRRDLIAGFDRAIREVPGI